MGKKINYGDPRKMDLGIDVLDSDAVQRYQERREKESLVYDGYTVKYPTEGKVVSVNYLGVSGKYLVFDGGFKDFVRIENRPQESKYLKNTNIGDVVDVYIVEINNRDFIIRGSISEIFTDMGVWLGIKKVIDTINANAAA